MRRKNQSTAVVRTWKKILAFSCNHGAHVDPLAVDAVVRVKQRWRPDVTVHLGDRIDTTCWRTGAHDTPDQSADPEADMHAGFAFLKETKPTHFCPGNHDIRPLKFLEHKDARIAHAATKCIQQIDSDMQSLGIKVLPDWSIWDHWEFGGVKYIHGFKFNVQAGRDHAIAMSSPVVFGHTHKCCRQSSDTHGGFYGIGVGTLARIRNMDYAKARGSTLGWSQGMVFGEFTDDRRKPESKLWLIDNGRNDEREAWRLPV